LKILFSPSETKVTGGTKPPITLDNSSFTSCKESKLYILNMYDNYLHDKDDTDLKKLFGIKKESEFLKNSSIKIFEDPTMKAIKRYTGVAYDYLDYSNLTKEGQEFIDNNLLIFSNLFGPLLAKDLIPYYKLKQGEKLDDFAIESFYSKSCKEILDDYLKDQFIVDLRAGFYLKFYKSIYPYITMKFIKNGKVVSHWAKAYRGLIVKQLANYQPQNENSFAKIPFENLSIVEIQKSGLKTEYIYEILS